MAWLEDRQIDVGGRDQQQQRAARLAERERRLSQLRTKEKRDYGRALLEIFEDEARRAEQQTERTNQHCLAAIGDIIEGARWPAWLGGLVTKPLLWQFAAAATRQYGASGEQMARQYQAVQRKSQGRKGAGMC
jgi:hypothetical protein